MHRPNMVSAVVVCLECRRRFDLVDENQAAEWHFGHDCAETEEDN